MFGSSASTLIPAIDFPMKQTLIARFAFDQTVQIDEIDIELLDPENIRKGI